LLCSEPCQGFRRKKGKFCAECFSELEQNRIFQLEETYNDHLVQLPAVEGMTYREEKMHFSAQKISLLYPVQCVALYYFCCSIVRPSAWAQAPSAVPDPIREGMISEAPLKGAPFVRSHPQMSAVLAPLGELLEEDVCLGKLFHFRHSTELCLQY